MHDDGAVGASGGEGSGFADVAMQDTRSRSGSSNSSSSSSVGTGGPEGGEKKKPVVFPRPQGFLELYKL